MIALRWLDRNFERYIVGLLLAAIVLLISANVFMRYILNASLSWGEELTLWLFVWFVWIAVVFGAMTAYTCLARIMLARRLLGEI